MAKSKTDTKKIYEYGIKEIIDIHIGDVEKFCFIFSKLPKKSSKLISRRIAEVIRREDLDQEKIEISEIELEIFQDNNLKVFAGIKK